MSTTAPILRRLHVQFATFRDGDPAGRARRAEAFRRAPAEERLVIETCHRVELISLAEASGPDPEDGAHATDAVRRVFEVVGGFDSAVVAEEQLLGQVRDAYRAALEEGTTGPVLNELLRRAIRFGRRVRAHALPGTDRSLADRGVRWLLERIEPKAPVLVAGTGEMGRLAAVELAAAGHSVTIASRSRERGERVLSALPAGGQHRTHVGPLDGDSLGAGRGAVLAVRAREPIVTAEMLRGRRPPILDLSMPSALAPDAAAALGPQALTVDALGAMTDASPVLAPAVERRLRDELEREVDGFVAWLQTRAAADALAILHGEAHAIRRRHLDRLRRRASLAPDQVAAVEAASEAMIGELLHGPSLALRRGDASAEAVRRLFGLQDAGAER